MRKWQDEYWLMLMQIYLKRPQGLKPMYSRDMVELGMEIHMPPKILYEQMFRLRQIDTPMMEHFWNTYGKHPKKLKKEVELLRRMNGFGNSDQFYEGVDINEGWEKDFRPIAESPKIKPVMLIVILDLYFRLTPNTMVEDTPEIRTLAQMIGIDTELVVEIMNIYQYCDPYLKRDTMPYNPLFETCEDVWKRYGNDKPQQLATTAAQMIDYFKH